MSISTSVTGVDASGEAFVYQPPNVVPVSKGYNIANGTYLQIQAGNTWPPSMGIWQVGNGSGASTVTEAVTYQVVTIQPL